MIELKAYFFYDFVRLTVLAMDSFDWKKSNPFNFSSRGHSSYVNCVAVYDTYVISGSADCTIRKWDMSTCECLFVYEGHTARVMK